MKKRNSKCRAIRGVRSSELAALITMEKDGFAAQKSNHRNSLLSYTFVQDCAACPIANKIWGALQDRRRCSKPGPATISTHG